MSLKRSSSSNIEGLGAPLQPFEIWKHLKSRNIWNLETFEIWLFDGQISHDPVFEWSGFSYSYSYSQSQPFKKPKYLKSERFCLEYKWFLTKWQLYVRISNGWASGFQIPFKIQTIWNPTSFLPFKIQTSPDFRSPCKFILVLEYFTLSGWMSCGELAPISSLTMTYFCGSIQSTILTLVKYFLRIKGEN